MTKERQLAPGETAARIGVSVETLRRWRSSGDGPPFVTLPGGSVRYRESSVSGWLDTAAGTEEVSA